MDKTDHVKSFRDHAEECRVLATIVQDPTARRGYLELARAYMVLAREEEVSTPMRKVAARPAALSSNVPRHRSVLRAACRALMIRY
jgi:hypothetical protein